MTKQDLPAPLTPAACDLRDFSFMPLDVVRLFSSEFHATANDAEWRAGVTLWGKAWHHVPAASLPDDDVALARLADLGKDLKSWRKVKAKALHGWIKCGDGRLYHRVVAEKALDAWIEKLGQRKSSGAGHAKRWGLPFEPQAFNSAIRDASQMLAALNPQSKTLQKKTAMVASGNANGNAGGSADRIANGNAGGIAESMPSACQETETVKVSKNAAPLRDARQGDTSEPGSSGSGPLDTKRWIFAHGLPWLEKQTGKAEGACRSLLGKFMSEAGDNAKIVRATIEAAQNDPPLDPIPWIRQGIKTRLQQQQPDPFEATDLYGWDRRLEEHKRNGAWPAKWGGAGPGEHPGHRLPTVAPVFAKHGYAFDTMQVA